MELQCFPVFNERPSQEFIAGWRDHLEKTGSPETYVSVSTSKPERSASVVLLSDEIKVPTLLRSGGEKVPCPLCSPTAPKFGKGRMAYFPDDLAVRFIGNHCAKHYLGENYTAAERLFRIEAQCLEYQAIWPKLNALLPRIEPIVQRVYGVGIHLTDLRIYIDRQAPGFARHFHGDLVAIGGRVFTSDSVGAQSEPIDGLEFLSQDFDPGDIASGITAACRDIRVPLPSWKIGDDENDASRLTIKRGRTAVTKLKALIALRDILEDAAGFLKPKNLRLLERWKAAGLSPFTIMTFKWDNRRLDALVESYAGRFNWSVIVPEDLLANLPSKEEIEALGLSEILN